MVELLFKFKFIRIADYSEIRFLAPVNVIQICLQRSGYRSKHYSVTRLAWFMFLMRSKWCFNNEMKTLPASVVELIYGNWANEVICCVLIHSNISVQADSSRIQLQWKLVSLRALLGLPKVTLCYITSTLVIVG